MLSRFFQGIMLHIHPQKSGFLCNSASSPLNDMQSYSNFHIVIFVRKLMKTVETPSDTVFEQGLKEILSSGSHDTESETYTDSVEQSPITRPRLNFSASSREEKKMRRVELIIRASAGLAALGLLAYFVLTITGKS
jgi:hypothetical protein